MGFETSKQLTPKEREQTKARIMSDAELLQGGASIRADGTMKLENDQIADYTMIMEKELGAYSERVSVNGIDFDISLDDQYKCYAMYFPQIKIMGDEASREGVYDSILPISLNRKIAKKVFDFAKQEAKKEENVYKLYNKVKDFVQELPEKDRE